MNNEELFGPAAQQKRILVLLRKEAKRMGAIELEQLVPEAPMTGKMKDHISKGFERLGAPPMLLGVIGSWGDTLKPNDIEDLLDNGYRMDTVFASTSD
jgi:hypothetical protein